MIEDIIRAVSRALMICSAASIAVMALVVAYSTLMRYVVGDSLSVTEELASFLLVTCIFMALPYAAMEGQHIKLTLFTSRLKPKMMAAVELATYAVAFLFFCLLTKLTFDFAYTGYLLNSHTETSYLYEAPWRAVMPLVSLWMAVVLFFFCVKRVIVIKSASQ
ncbi:MAG: TRAP transporter small permease subunit [Burkholderiaceae bacterium]